MDRLKKFSKTNQKDDGKKERKKKKKMLEQLRNYKMT